MCSIYVEYRDKYYMYKCNHVIASAVFRVNLNGSRICIQENYTTRNIIGHI